MSGAKGPAPADIQAAFCAVLADEWARAGTTDAVVAPGSRSTPLVVALDADARIRVHVVLDERSAGFVALGIGMLTGRPPVVVTTSGTASVELHPAIVEAFHSGIALIAVTADRPPELHGVGAAQTIEQESMFGRSVRWAVSPGTADAAAAGSWRSLASRIFAEAAGVPGPPGPVHVNLAFREPLLGDAGAVALPAGRADGRAWHATGTAVAPPPRRADLAMVEFLAGYAGGRGMVVAGHGAGDPARLVAAAHGLGWVVVADPRSGCRRHAGSVAAVDPLLRLPDLASGWIPEVVVRAGAPHASRVMSQWLASLSGDVPQVLADRWTRWMDPERQVSEIAGTDGATLLSAVAERAQSLGGPEAPSSAVRDPGWRERWLEAEAAAQRVFDRLLGPGGELELSEPAIARALLGSVTTPIVVSSSMPVRDAEWFGPPGSQAVVLSNRGVNGIDGVVSTAVGVALAANEPTFALAGDLAFLYDTGALLGASGRRMSLTVVVVDNDGGGIFSFLPQASALSPECFETYWGTPHGLDLTAVARAYGARSVAIRKRAHLDELIAGAGDSGITVAVVGSERAANVSAHERLNAEVQKAVAPLVQAGL